MADQTEVEKQPDRPAWEVRRGGTLVGIVWRESRDRFRAAREGQVVPRTFRSLDDAVEELVRGAGPPRPGRGR